MLEKLLEVRGGSEEEVLLVYEENLRLMARFPRNGDVAEFGFWEGPHDLELHKEAFGIVEAEARKRGYRALTGPINFNTFHRYRLRIQDPVSWACFTGEPDNPAYYPALLREMGFRVVRKYQSHYVSPEEVREVYRRQEPFLRRVKELPFELQPIDADFWEDKLPELFALLTEIFSGNPNFRHIRREEFQIDYGPAYGAMLCPHTSVLFIDKASREWAAISLCMPNYEELNRPQENYSFERDYPHLPRKTFLAKTIGAKEKYRGQRLIRYLAAYGMLRFPEYYEDAIFCLMREDNPSNSFTARHRKEVADYALFSKELF